MFSMNRKFNYTNKYIPPHEEHLPLPWYERDGLMSYIDAMKHEESKEDSQGHFQRTKVVNFAMIHVQAEGEKTDDKPYTTLCEKELRRYKNKDDIVSSAIRVSRKDIHIEKQLLVKHFNGNL